MTQTAGTEHWAGTNKSILPKLVEYGLVEQLLDLVEDGIVVHDENRKIFLINQPVEVLTGLDRDQILGQDCHVAFGPLGLCGVACGFKDHEETNNVLREREVIFTRFDGETRRINVKSTPIMLDKRKRGVLAIIKDVTEVSNLKWQLKKTREFHGMIGISSIITEVFELLKAVGSSDYPVLITGESGTGKELAARAIHLESNRESGPFVPINCGALPENILESELFGHVRGAFTGAIQDKKGRFELANNGTLFLDEVGELPLHMQVKLLRVLQEKTFERVGGERSIRTDVRIVAATNRDLRKMVEEGTFREDLFYRLCVVPVELPALRNRTDDIPHIAEKILEKVSAETGKSISKIDDDAMRILLNHTWPGNVRELINALQYSSVRCAGDTIFAEYLPYEIRHPRRNSTLPPAPQKDSTSIVSRVHGNTVSPIPPQSPPQPRESASPPPVQGFSGSPNHSPVDLPVTPQPKPPTAEKAEKKRRTKLTTQMVLDAIEQAQGNKRNAAKILGVGRATLYRFFDNNPDLFG